MSEHKTITNHRKQRGISRRDVLKSTGAAALGAATMAPKASSAFAAPAVIQNEPVTLTYATWFWWEPGRQDAWRFIVEKFNSSQNDIRIEEGGWPFNDFTRNIIVQAQAGGVEADLVQTTPDLVLRLLDANQIAPVQDVVDSLGITTLNPAHNYITIDGQVYGLDVVTVAFGLFYNAAMYEGAGISSLPASTDEWLTVSEQLTERPNQFGSFSPHVLAEPESFWFTLQQWAMPFGGLWAEGDTPLVTSEPILNAVSLFKNFYDRTFPQGTNEATANRMWANQQIASELIVSAAVNTYKAEAPEFYPNIRSMPLPWEGKDTIARIHPITVNANGEHVDEAKHFLEFLYTPENYRELLTRSLDVIPAYDVGGLDDYFADIQWLEGFQDVNYLTPPDVVGDFVHNNQEFGQIVISKVSEVLTGNQAVEDAMADAQVELEDLASRLE